MAKIMLISLISQAMQGMLLAEDYPSEYTGPGFRDYLDGKIANGYSIDEFSSINVNREDWKNKMNMLSQMLGFSYQAMPESSYTTSSTANEQGDNSYILNREVATRNQQRNKLAAAEGEFNYIPFSDGKIEYFKDGQVSKIEKERVVDEFGNLSLKNTKNMKYNEKRLLAGYEAEVKDNLGNISLVTWYGVEYTPDSVFYGDEDTNANKNISEYYTKEIDPSGNVKITHWKAQKIDGKLVSSFTQKIEDEIYGTVDFTRTDIVYEKGKKEQPASYHEEGITADGLTYVLDRTDVTYTDDDQVAGYHETTGQTFPDGLERTIVTDAEFSYLKVSKQFGEDVKEKDPDRLLGSIITTSTGNADGSFKTETTRTSYVYDDSKDLISGSATSEFSGHEAHWLEEATQELKEGVNFKGSATTTFETLFGEPMAKQTSSTTQYFGPTDGSLLSTEETERSYTNGLANNLRRLLSTSDHSVTTYTKFDSQGKQKYSVQDIITTYIHAENGNLIDAKGIGTGSGYELTDNGWMVFDSDIAADYSVYIGEAMQDHYQEIKNYKPQQK
jgi:hypothetical protein